MSGSRSVTKHTHQLSKYDIAHKSPGRPHRLAFHLMFAVLAWFFGNDLTFTLLLSPPGGSRDPACFLFGDPSVVNRMSAGLCWPPPKARGHVDTQPWPTRFSDRHSNAHTPTVLAHRSSAAHRQLSVRLPRRPRELTPPRAPASSHFSEK